MNRADKITESQEYDRIIEMIMARLRCKREEIVAEIDRLLARRAELESAIESLLSRLP